MSAALEAAEIIRAGDEFKQERQKTFDFATMASRPILPLEVLGKGTLCGEHTDSNWHPDKLTAWSNALQIDHLNKRPELNVGVLFGEQAFDIDIDSKDPMLLAALDHYLAPFPTPYKWGRSGKKRSHQAYILAEPFDRALHARAIQALAEDHSLRIEIRAGESKSNFYAVMPGSIHNTGELVVWDKGFDPRVTPAPLSDVRPLLIALRRAVAAALIARQCTVQGERHYLFLALTGMLVRMWRQAEDSGNPESAMNEDEAFEFFELVRALAGDDDDGGRKQSFRKTWKKYCDDPNIPIAGGTSLARRITAQGADGNKIRNLLYKLLVDDEQFEVAEAALERFVMIRTPSAGILDLETLRPNLRVTGAMKSEDVSMLFTSMKVPFGDSFIPLPQFLKHSSQVVKATGLELRPDLPAREIFRVQFTEEEHGYHDESVWINAWVGFQYAPSPSVATEDDIRQFLDYVREIIADGKQDRFEWVMAWLADIFQDPANKPGTLLALTGPQGSGKTMLGEIIGKIIGDAHYGKIGSIEDLTKEFNSRVHYKLFVQADETGAGQKTAIARDLKELVTGQKQTIVYKGREGIPSNNPARYFFTSNESGHALKVEPGNERRYTILEVSGKRVGDLDFWQNFVDWWSTPKNLRAIHSYLKHYKYEKKLIRKALGTLEKRQHQMNAMPPVIQWALQRASEGHPLSPKTHVYSYQAYQAKMVKQGTQVRVSPAPDRVDRMEWPNLVELAALSDDFNDWLRSNNIRALQPANSVSKFFSELRGGSRMEYNSISALRDGIKVRPKLMRFPTRQEYIDGISRMFPSLEKEIREATDAAEQSEMAEGEETGEF